MTSDFNQTAKLITRPSNETSTSRDGKSMDSRSTTHMENISPTSFKINVFTEIQIPDLRNYGLHLFIMPFLWIYPKHCDTGIAQWGVNDPGSCQRPFTGVLRRGWAEGPNQMESIQHICFKPPVPYPAQALPAVTSSDWIIISWWTYTSQNILQKISYPGTKDRNI